MPDKIAVLRLDTDWYESTRAELEVLFPRLVRGGVILIDDYGASDDRSMAADNTSAFNCRRAAGSTSWSMHAYGRAIDINPRENPMILGGRAHPPNAARSGRGVIRRGDVVVRAFARVGWSWGGRWTSPDYQHFSATGG